jgi:hypothetical protein
MLMWKRVLRAVSRDLSVRPRGRRARPRVTELEAREVPATFTVTNLNDFGLGSLRQATFDANAAGGLDDIVFAGAATSGTITLTSGQLFLSGPTNLIGPGAGNLTVSGNNASRLFFVNPGGGQPVTISGLTLTRGNGTGPGPSGGGAITHVGGNLTIESSVLTGNTSPNRGGAIFSGYNGSLLTIRNSTISGNSSPGPGGGIYARSYVGPNGTRIENSTISGNQSTSGVGGGVFSYRSPMQVVNSTISGNTSQGPGGGLYVRNAGVSAIDGSTISGNRSNSSSGGGVFATVNNLLEVRNSTISGNTSSGPGAGLYAVSNSTLNLRNSTVAENISTSSVGAGVFLAASGPHQIDSSIVANNVAPSNPPTADVFNNGTLLHVRHSLFRVPVAGSGVNGTNLNNIVADPQLGPLANNGGLTATHAIPSTSPAVDVGLNPLGLAVDQRGTGFARAENGLVDIGAVEWDTALVTNLNDSGPGSLRAAVLRANETPDVTPVRFAPGLTGTINLTSGNIPLSQPLDIVGPGAGLMNVSGALQATAPNLDVSMTGLTLSNPTQLLMNYNVTTSGDLAFNVPTGNVTFVLNLNVTAGTVTVTESNIAELGSVTQLAAGAVLTTGIAFNLGFGDTLLGNGTLNGDLLVLGGGTVSPAPGTATLTVNGDLIVAPGGTLNLDLNGPAAGEYDQLVVNGAINLFAGALAALNTGFTPAPGTVFTLLANDGADAPNGNLNSIPNGGTVVLNGVLHQLRYDGGDGNDITLAANTAPVLNPAASTNLSPIPEDLPPAFNVGTSVDDLLGTGGLYSDVAGTLRAGMAVIGLDSANGTWQFSLNGGGVWTDFGAVSPTAATLLQADGSGATRVRFLPAANFNGIATIQFQAWDGLDGSANGTTGVNATSTGPNGVFGSQTETGSIIVLSVNDAPDAVNDTATVDEDGGAQTIDVLANDTSILEGETLIVGSVTQGAHGTVAIAVDGLSVTYTPDPDFAGTDTFLYSVSDGNGGSDFAAVTVTVANDAADRLEVVPSAGTTTFTEGGGAVVVDAGVGVGSGLEGILKKATVRFASGYVKGKDKLFFTPLPNIPIKGTFSALTGTLTLTGAASPADYETALRSVTYNNASPLPVDGVRTLHTRVQDAAGLGDPATKLLRVIGVNTKPTLTLTSSALTYRRGRPAVAVASTLVIKDVDNTRLQGATVAITGGFAANQDVLTAINKVGITKSYDAATGILTLSGNATLASYLAVLRSVKFSTPLAAPVGPRTLTITVTDGQLTSDPVARTVNVV